MIITASVLQFEAMLLPCEVVQFISSTETYILLFLPPLPSLIGGFGKYCKAQSLFFALGALVRPGVNF